jgi:hypothetical protein
MIRRGSRKGEKIQTPNIKIQTNFKHQPSNERQFQVMRPFWSLKFEVSLMFEF